MSERRVNLEEILFAEANKLRKDNPKIDLYSNNEMKESPEFAYFISAMKEACRQTLELAAENAITKWGQSVVKVDKQSILDIIKQIE